MKPVLIILTNQDHYDGYNIPTGLWLGELTHFYHELEQKHIPMQLASPKGGRVPLDPASLADNFMDSETKPYFEDKAFMALLENTAALSSLNPADYAAIYFTGGHGAMYDFAVDERVGQWIADFTAANKPVAAVCHGVAALTNPKLAEQDFLKGKTVTGYSNVEEAYVKHTEHVPFLLEDKLQDLGANFEQVAPFSSHVLADGLLLTGQNPQSTKELAQALMQTLEV